MTHDPRNQSVPAAPRRALARLIDGFNPGITLLVLVWVVGMYARGYVDRLGQLTGATYAMLTSLVYVVPIMLVGWGVLAVCDRMFGLDLFRRDE